MNNNLVMRAAEYKDLTYIAEIERECFSEPWTFSALRDFMFYDYSYIIVAEHGGEIAGYVTFTVLLDELQVANVAVSKQFRRMHIGSNLVKQLIEVGKSKKCQYAYLEVRKSNDSAIELYKKNGFEIVGERKNFYSFPIENALLMNFTF